jgi:hypothetical protein
VFHSKLLLFVFKNYTFNACPNLRPRYFTTDRTIGERSLIINRRWPCRWVRRRDKYRPQTRFVSFNVCARCLCVNKYKLRCAHLRAFTITFNRYSLISCAHFFFSTFLLLSYRCQYCYRYCCAIYLCVICLATLWFLTHLRQRSLKTLDCWTKKKIVNE